MHSQTCSLSTPKKLRDYKTTTKSLSDLFLCIMSALSCFYDSDKNEKIFNVAAMLFFCRISTISVVFFPSPGCLCFCLKGFFPSAFRKISVHASTLMHDSQLIFIYHYIIANAKMAIMRIFRCFFLFWQLKDSNLKFGTHFNCCVVGDAHRH